MAPGRRQRNCKYKMYEKVVDVPEPPCRDIPEDLPQSYPVDDGGKSKTNYIKKTVNVVEYDMESVLQSCCETYDRLVETTGGKVKWEPASTPSLTKPKSQTKEETQARAKQA